MHKYLSLLSYLDFSMNRRYTYTIQKGSKFLIVYDIQGHHEANASIKFFTLR